MKQLMLAGVAIGVALGAAAVAQQRPDKSNMDLVGYDELQGRSAYQPIVHKQGDRFIAYVGHHGGSALNPASSAGATTMKMISSTSMTSTIGVTFGVDDTSPLPPPVAIDIRNTS